MKRWINTKVVIDIETGETLYTEGFWYEGEVAEAIAFSTLMVIYAVVSTLLTAATSYYSYYSEQKAANQQAQYESDMADYEEKVAENNALAAQYEAQHAREEAAEKAKQHRQQVSVLLGKQRAGMGATGAMADEGSFMDLSLETVEQGKLDELAILHEGDLEAWRANVRGMNYQAQAGLHAGASSFASSKIKSPSSGALSAGLISGARTGLGYYSTFKTGAY